jgi:ribosomal protein L32
MDHSRLTHVHLIKKEPVSLCDSCYETLIIEHIVINCPKHTEARKILKNLVSLHQAFNYENTAAINTFSININLSYPL